MAVHYVDITRDELEEWLSSLSHKWTRDMRTSGIYYIHLSDVVAIKMSSSQTSSYGSMGYAEGSMKLSLVSLVTKQLLNKKDADRSHFKRTTNWKKTWKDGVDHWESVYKQAKGFYDRIAEIEDRNEYKKNLLEKIESVSGWEKITILSQLHEKVSNNNIISTAQEEAINKFVRTKPVVQQKPISEPVQQRYAPEPVQQRYVPEPVQQRHTPEPVQRSFDPSSASVVFTPEQQRAMARLEALVDVATPTDKTFTLIMINKAKKGIKLSDEEKQKLMGLLRSYSV